jgi:hypothetical protein
MSATTANFKGQRYSSGVELDNEWPLICSPVSMAMDSQFYDQSSPVKPHNKCSSPQHFPQNSRQSVELSVADLTAPELTFDHMSIQQFITNEINSNTNTSLDDSVSIFSALLNDKQQSQQSRNTSGHQNQHQRQQQQRSEVADHNNSTNSYGQSSGQTSHSHHSDPFSMPQQSSVGNERYGLDANSVVKQEPIDPDVDFSSSCSQNSGYSGSYSGHYDNRDQQMNGRTDSAEQSPLSLVHFGGNSMRSGHKGHKNSKKNVDKASDEYKKRRERNNIAVRKSREKAKIRSRETEKKVSELARENDSLRKKVDMLSKELNVLKSLLTNVGVPAESVDTEIAKGLQMDGHSSTPYGSSM